MGMERSGNEPKWKWEWPLFSWKKIPTDVCIVALFHRNWHNISKDDCGNILSDFQSIATGVYIIILNLFFLFFND